MLRSQDLQGYLRIEIMNTPHYDYLPIIYNLLSMHAYIVGGHVFIPY